MLKSFFTTFIFLVTYSSIFCQDTIPKKWETDLSTELEVENQLFNTDALYLNQKSHFLSGALKPKLDINSSDGKHFFKIELFARGSFHDINRSHFDIRQAYYQRKINSWNFTIGVRRVFWGVTESNHLVDIINQIDALESTDGSEKLGQTMVQVSKKFFLGNFDFFYLPYSRKIQFASETGRNRFPIALNRDDIDFTSRNKQWQPSFAMRWSKTIKNISFGLSHFYGNSREPLFLGFSPLTGLNLSYPVINQSGFDFQYNTNALILKLESIYRTSNLQEFIALTSGFEYTLGNINGNGLDIGIVSEYTYDSRKLLTFSGFDNDLFLGSRIALNDDKNTECIFGGLFDLNKSTKLFRLQASRRLGNSFKIALKTNILTNVDTNEILYNFRNDDLIELKISKFF